MNPGRLVLVLIMSIVIAPILGCSDSGTSSVGMFIVSVNGNLFMAGQNEPLALSGSNSDVRWGAAGDCDRLTLNGQSVSLSGGDISFPTPPGTVLNFVCTKGGEVPRQITVTLV